MIKNVDLISKLGDLLNRPPISIELLPGNTSDWLASAPPEHAPFLFVDNNLGVPHKLAYKAYLEAVARFRAVRPRPSHNASDSSPCDSEELLASSAVLLLVNPAHQTALNARKRLVLKGTTHPAPLELRFTDALLTLREGAKQSVLWHHRRWLLRRIHPLLVLPSSSSTRSQWYTGHGDGLDSLHGVLLPADAFRAEIGAVERACEAYPRNYHAWAHRFLCAEALLLSFSSSSCSPTSTAVCGSTPSPHDKIGAIHELEEERARIRTWVERHVADYSAMQYACRLEVLLRDLGLPGVDLPRTDGGKGKGAGPDALELVRAYPSHEALWLYLRGALALSLFPLETRGDADAAIDELVGEYVGEGADVVPGTRDVDQAHAHAVRFVAWRAWLRAGRCVDGTVVRKIAAAAEGEVKVTSEGALLSYLSAKDVRADDGRREGV